MSRNQTLITPQLAGYIREVTPPEPDALRRLREGTAKHPLAHLQISPEQGRFLSLLVRATGAKRALEVGVFMGYSSVWVASALPPDGRLIACDLSKEFTDRARATWRDAGVEEKIELRLAPAVETLDALLAEGQAGTFDFAFIDADKESYLNYYERALALLRRGGLITADNVLCRGRVAATGGPAPEAEPVHAYNSRLRDDPRVFVSLVPIGDGISVACKL